MWWLVLVGTLFLVPLHTHTHLHEVLPHSSPRSTGPGDHRLNPLKLGATMNRSSFKVFSCIFCSQQSKNSHTASLCLTTLKQVGTEFTQMAKTYGRCIVHSRACVRYVLCSGTEARKQLCLVLPKG